MTFSDSRIVKLLQDEFIPVWESVSPVREVTFDLGEGRSVSGTVGGEIAIYFCTPEGYVFDILPALQSPVATKQAMEVAVAFYRSSKDTLKRIKIAEVDKSHIVNSQLFQYDSSPYLPIVEAWHRQRMGKQLLDIYKADPAAFEERIAPALVEHPDSGLIIARLTDVVGNPIIDMRDPAIIKAEELYPQAKLGEEKRDKYISAAMDEATRDMRVMMLSKVAVAQPSTPITVVEPGGRGYFMWQIHRAFLGVNPNSNTTFPTTPWSKGLRKPSDWKEPLFVHILKQPLKGGKVTYDSESLEAISIIEER